MGLETTTSTTCNPLRHAAPYDVLYMLLVLHIVVVPNVYTIEIN